MARKTRDDVEWPPVISLKYNTLKKFFCLQTEWQENRKFLIVVKTKIEVKVFLRCSLIYFKRKAG